MLEITARERFELLWILMLDHSLALQFKRIGPWAASGEDSSLVLIRFHKAERGRIVDDARALFLRDRVRILSGALFASPADLNSNSVTENTAGSARISFRQCRSLASDHQRFGTVARR